MKNIFVFSILYLGVGNHFWGITYPVTPKEPKKPTVLSVGNNSVKKNSYDIPNNTSTQKVKIVLQNSKTLQGSVRFPTQISFYHYIGDIRYFKKVKSTELSFFKILSYKVKTQEQQKGSTFYEYKPKLIQIQLKNGKNFTVSANFFSFLEKITIHTKNGETTVFSIFADTYHPKTGWLEVSNKDKSYHKENGHPLSVKEIYFL